MTQARSPAPAMGLSAPRGNRRTTHRQMRSPSYRKKYVVNSATSIPDRTSTATVAVVTPAEASLSRLRARLSMTCWLKLRICASDRCSGPTASHSRTCRTPSCTLTVRVAKLAANWAPMK